MDNELLLTEAERERFAAYLERVALSDEAISRQMIEISAPTVLVVQQREQAAACRRVVDMLRSTLLISSGQG